VDAFVSDRHAPRLEELDGVPGAEVLGGEVTAAASTSTVYRTLARDTAIS
jgi:hypothetical protein